MWEPWGRLPSSPLPLHLAWWAAPSCRVSSGGGKTELRAELGAWPKAGGCCLEPLHTNCLATQGQPGPQASQSPPRNNPTPHGVPTWADPREERWTPPCPPPGRLRAQDCRVSDQWSYLRDSQTKARPWRPLQTRGASGEEDGPRSPSPRALRLGAPSRGRSALPGAPQAARPAGRTSERQSAPSCAPPRGTGSRPRPRAHRRPRSPGGVRAGRRRVCWRLCPGASVREPRGAGRPRAPAPAQGQPARGDSNLPLRFLPAPRPGPYARPSLLPSQAPTDGQADARTKGPAHGRPGAGLREEQVSAPTPLAARTRSALERRGPSARTAGPRASVSPGGGTTRGSAWVYRPGWDARGIRERGLPWAGGQEPGPAAWPAPSGPGAAP